MPELPEVETVKRGLERTIISKTVQAVLVRVPKLFPDDQQVIEQVLVGAKVLAITRRAKVLLIELSSGWSLAIHLKMTGQLIVVRSKDKKIRSGQVQKTLDSTSFVGGHPEKAYEQPLPHQHTHVIISFTDGTQLFFNDLRKFGWLRLFPREVVNHTYHLTLVAFLDSLQLGPEPLSEDFTLEYLLYLLKKRSIPIKQLLLEQQGIAGIGNIYADEALFYAKIDPKRPAASLKRAEVARLYAGIQVVLERGIEFGGTSKNTYLNVEGTKGEMQKYLMVYGREGLSCKECGTLIERIKLGQRSSHFCPRCQK